MVRPYDLTLSTKSGGTTGDFMLARRDKGDGNKVPAWEEQREKPYVQGIRTRAASLDDTDPLRDLTFAQHDWQDGAAIRSYSEEGKNGYEESSWDMMWPHVAKPGIPRNYGDQRGNTGAPVGLFIHNPFFEVNNQTADGWVSYNSPSSVNYYATTDPRTDLLGTHHARVTTGAVANRGIKYTIETGGSFLTGFQSKTIVFSVYAKIVSGTGPVEVRVEDGVTNTSGSSTSATTYTLLSVSHAVNAAATKIDIIVRGTAGAGCVFDVDDASVYVGNATPTQAVVFEDVVYQAFGRAVCRLRTTDDDMAWEPVYIGSASCTDLAVYKEYIYAAFGASTAYVYSANGTSWTPAAGGSGNDTYAIKLVTSRNKLFKAETHNSIRSSDNDPATGADWDTAYTVGSATTEIVKLYDYLDTVWVGKEDGLWSFLANYEDGYAGNVFINQIPEYATNTTTENFSRGVVHDKALWIKPSATGLRRIDGYSDRNLSDLVTRPASGLTGNVRSLCSFYDRLFIFIDDKLYAIRNTEAEDSDNRFVKHSMLPPTVSTSIVSTASPITVTTSANTPDTAANGAADTPVVGAISWDDPTFVTANDSAYSIAPNLVPGSGQSSRYLMITDFDFDLPTGATISGVTVNVDHKVSIAGGNMEFQVYLVVGGAVAGSARSHTNCAHTSETLTEFGGSSDLWGTSLSVADVEATNFGIAVVFAGGSGGGYTSGMVDYVTVALTYSLPTTQADGINVAESVVASWSCGPGTATVKPHLIATLDGIDTGGQVLAFSDVWALPERGALATQVNSTPILTTSEWDGGFPSDHKTLDYVEVLLTDPDVNQTIAVTYGKDGQDPDAITLGTIATNNYAQRLYTYGLSNYEQDAVGYKFQFQFTGSNISDMGIDGFVVHTRLHPHNSLKVWEAYLLLGSYTNTGVAPVNLLPAQISTLLTLEETHTALTLTEDFDNDGTDSTRYVAIIPGSVQRSYDKTFTTGPNMEVWRVLFREVRTSD